MTFVPSRRHPELVADFARRLAETLGLPCEDVVVKVRDTEPQKTMENSAQQYRNVHGAFEVGQPVPSGPVLLVDDVVDSRWTITAIAWKLLEAGLGPRPPLGPGRLRRTVDVKSEDSLATVLLVSRLVADGAAAAEGGRVLAAPRPGRAARAC